MSYGRGDVVFGHDPFTSREAPRPWLVVSTDRNPFQGEQYIAVTMTTRSWHDDFFDLSDDDWEVGGTPEDSRVVPWGVGSPDHDDLDHDRHVGRLEEAVVDEIVSRLAGYLGR